MGRTEDVLGLKIPKSVAFAASFVPFLGSAMDVKTAIQDPSLNNIGSAALSIGADVSGLSVVKGLFKGVRLANKVNKAKKAYHVARKNYNHLNTVINRNAVNRTKYLYGNAKTQYNNLNFTDKAINNIRKSFSIGLIGSSNVNNYMSYYPDTSKKISNIINHYRK